MPVSVDVFVQTSNTLINKVQSGNSITSAQRNLLMDSAQMACYEQDRLVFLKTGESSDFLDWFLKNTIINPSSLTGYANYPTGFQHTAGVRSYYGGKERPVELVDNKAWGEVQASELMGASLIFPKYTEFEGEYRFLPRNIL